MNGGLHDLDPEARRHPGQKVGSLVLVLNVGSSSLKYRVVRWDTEATIERGSVERIEESGWDDAFAEVWTALSARGP